MPEFTCQNCLATAEGTAGYGVEVHFYVPKGWKCRRVSVGGMGRTVVLIACGRECMTSLEMKTDEELSLL
jgi:hypothetical protein